MKKRINNLFDLYRGVAYNKNTSPETLNELSKDKDKYVRREVAENPNTSSETLHNLSKDKKRWQNESR